MHLFFLIYEALLSASSFVLSSGVVVVIVAFSSAVLSMTFSRNFLLCLFWLGTEVVAVVLISVKVGCEMVDAKNFLSPLLLCSVVLVVVLEAEK